MRRRVLVGIVVLLLTRACAFTPDQGALGRGVGAGGEGAPVPTLAPMLERVLPGVVSVSAQGELSAEEQEILRDPGVRRFFGLPLRPQPGESRFSLSGSGVVVDANRGYVMTSLHVIDGADTITIAFSDGRRADATLVEAEPAVDMAVLGVKAQGLTALPLGNSDAVRVGDYVVAVGNPFGLGQTATLGIISGLGRTEFDDQGYDGLIQTDASMNPGNSGGALVNLRGELVGVSTAILGSPNGNVGISFAVPINRARGLIQRLTSGPAEAGVR